MRTLAIPGAALCAALLAACSGLRSQAPPEQTYVLHAAAPEAGAAAVPGVLSVLRPGVQPGLDTDRIVLMRNGQELDYFAASRWGESLPRVVAALAVQSLSGGGGFANVVDADRTAVSGDFQLLLTVRDFEAVYETADAPPVIHVAFECALLAGSPRHIIGRCDASAMEPADQNHMRGIVAAMQRAARRALAEVRSKAVAVAREGRGE